MARNPEWMNWTKKFNRKKKVLMDNGAAQGAIKLGICEGGGGRTPLDKK